MFKDSPFFEIRELVLGGITLEGKTPDSVFPFCVSAVLLAPPHCAFSHSQLRRATAKPAQSPSRSMTPCVPA